MPKSPFILALEIQLEEVALLASEPDQIKWSFLRSPSARYVSRPERQKQMLLTGNIVGYLAVNI